MDTPNFPIQKEKEIRSKAEVAKAEFNKEIARQSSVESAKRADQESHTKLIAIVGGAVFGVLITVSTGIVLVAPIAWLIFAGGVYVVSSVIKGREDSRFQVFTNSIEEKKAQTDNRFEESIVQYKTEYEKNLNAEIDRISKSSNGKKIVSVMKNILFSEIDEATKRCRDANEKEVRVYFGYAIRSYCIEWDIGYHYHKLFSDLGIADLNSQIEEEALARAIGSSLETAIKTKYSKSECTCDFFIDERNSELTACMRITYTTRNESYKELRSWDD